MKLEGEHTFPVSRADLWSALLDPELLARVLPGAEPLESTGENSYRAGMTVAIGPVKGRFQGNLVLTDLVPPSSYRMKIDGSGPAGFLRGSGGIELIDAGGAAGATLLRYAMDAQVGGKMASVGQRLIESSGRAIAKQGLEGLERELALRTARLAQPNHAAAGESTAVDGCGSPTAGPAAAAPSPSATPSQAAFAGRVARGIWAELPPSWKVGILLIAGAVLFGLVFALKSC